MTPVRRAALPVLVFLLLAVPAAAAPGELDRTFSGDGWVRTYEISGFSKGFFPKGAEDVAIQPDGKILAVSELQDGNSHWWFGVYRWLPNGDLDQSFGSGGWVANDLGAFPMPHTVALQSDGKILVGGQIECPGLATVLWHRPLQPERLDRRQLRCLRRRASDVSGRALRL